MKKKKRVLITGASSGIGYEMAKVFAENGYDLILVARREERLELIAKELIEKYGVELTFITKDLSQIDAGEEIFKELKKQNLIPDVLVNNAGFGAFCSFSEMDQITLIEMLRVNIMALTQLTRFLLPEMLKKGKGGILNVASVVGFLPGGPFMAVYSATKAYVLSLSLALSRELKGSGVRVTALCPGTTKTEFFKRAGIQPSFLEKRAMNARDVARCGYQALMKGKRIAVPGLKNRLIALLLPLFPKRVVLDVVGKRLSKEIK